MAAGGEIGGGLRRRGALHQYSQRFGPNMTPMVDIVMVILIFFMAATSFVGDELQLRSVIEQDSPDRLEASDPMELPPVRLELVLRGSGAGENGESGQAEWAGVRASGVGMEQVSVDALVSGLRRFVQGTASDQIVVVIRSEASVPYAAVVRLHEACSDLGLERVGITLDRR